MRRVISHLIIILIFVGFEVHAQEKNYQDKITIKRFAMVIGANNGGRGRAKLQYAVSDAKAFIRVLETLGGVYPDDSRLLIQPSRNTIFWEFSRFRDRLKRAREQHDRVQAIFYYSGHSDEKSFLIGKEKLTYEEFKKEINQIEADVRIIVLDSCMSGAFTQVKGVKKGPPFLVDSAHDMKGYAIMTSSSSTEASQESARLKGSYFTHYLLSGLRGGADMTQDGKITLSEAYLFAHAETLQETEKTVSGPQHPHYNIQMSGTGEVIITDIRKSASTLTISKDVSGRIFIHDKKHILVLELNKLQDREVELGLEPGKYRVINIKDGNIFEYSVQLNLDKTTVLRKDQFKKSDKIDAVARGDLKWKARPRIFKKRHKKTNFFIAYDSKYTRAYNKGALMMGFNFGLTFNKSFSIGFAGYSNTHDFPMGHPVMAGLILEYALPSRNYFNIKVGSFFGTGEEYLLNRYFSIVEPQVSVTFNVTRILNISTGVSLRLTSLKDSQMAPLSWCFNIRFGK